MTANGEKDDRLERLYEIKLVRMFAFKQRLDIAPLQYKLDVACKVLRDSALARIEH